MKPHRTLRMVRRLQALGPVRNRRRGGRLPRQQHPDTVALDYFKAIRYVVDAAHAAVQHIMPTLVHELTEMRRRQRKHDVVKGPPPDGPEAKRGRSLVDEAARRFSSSFKPSALHDVTMQFGKKTSDFQRAQLDQQVRQAVGVPFSAIEKPTRDRVHLFASSNVELIKTVPDRYFDRVIKTVTDAYASGMHPETMAEQIAEEYDMAINDAMRIARDQVGKLNAQVNQDRQEAIGLTGFIWRGTLDNRERQSHRDLEGQHFDWDDLPVDDETGEEIAPGDAILCRCYAEPDFSDILNPEE